LKDLADRAGYEAGQVICTGDMVGYCADANQTVALFRSWGVHAIQGNVEIQLASESDDCGCNFNEGSVCKELSNRWYDYARQNLERQHAAWFAALPQILTLTWRGKRIVVLHGGYTQTAMFIFRTTTQAVKLAEMAACAADIVIGGHAGLPFVDEVAPGKYWVNAGVIGMPPNDGTDRVWYLKLVPGDDGLKLRHEAYRYDAAKARSKMLEASLPEAYANALVTGIWPSHDILPAVEAAAAGQPLAIKEWVVGWA